MKKPAPYNYKTQQTPSSGSFLSTNSSQLQIPPGYPLSSSYGRIQPHLTSPGVYPMMNQSRTKQSFPQVECGIPNVYSAQAGQPRPPICPSQQKMADIRPFIPEPVKLTKRNQIEQFLKANKITSLTHFTRLENLKSILQNGIFTGMMLSADPKFSDIQRNQPKLPESWQGSASMNISFPDFRLLSQLRENLSRCYWVIIEIDARFMMDQPCYFFQKSAVEIINDTEFSQNINPLLQTTKMFRSLFTDTETIKRNKLGIPDAYPTNPQAEVLTFSPVPTRYFQKVNFCNDYIFNEWVLNNLDFATSLDKKIWQVSMRLFSPRCDYVHWKTRQIIDK